MTWIPGGRRGDKLSLIKCKERRTKENLLQQKILKTMKTLTTLVGLLCCKPRSPWSLCGWI